MSRQLLLDDLPAVDDLDRYARLALIRRFEERVGQLIALGHISIPCRLSVGKEAVAVGIAEARGPSDPVVSSTCGQGIMLALGFEPVTLLAHLAQDIGSEDPVRFVAPDLGYFGCHAIDALALARGIELAQAARELATPDAVICLLSDAARAQEAVFERLRQAHADRLPLVLAIERERETECGAGSSLERRTPDIEAIGIDGAVVEATEVRSVLASVKMALQTCRAGGGPVALEMLTYPFQSHAAQAAGIALLPRETVDPVAKARANLVADASLSEAHVKARERAVRDRISAAVAHVRASE